MGSYKYLFTKIVSQMFPIIVFLWQDKLWIIVGKAITVDQVTYADEVCMIVLRMYKVL